jgi:hypothetical protein
VTVPIYAAHGAVTTSVGWFSRRLHLFYERAIRGERVAAIRQIASTIRHEVNNALAGMSAEAQLLDDSQRVPHVEDREAVRRIRSLTTASGRRSSSHRVSPGPRCPTTSPASRCWNRATGAVRDGALGIRARTSNACATGWRVVGPFGMASGICANTAASLWRGRREGTTSCPGERRRARAATVRRSPCRRSAGTSRSPCRRR